MKIKSTIKSVVAILLVVCSLFGLAACVKKEKDNRDKLPNQVENYRYYFKQGYSDLWKVNMVGEDEFLIEDYKDQGLALQLVPFQRTEKTDDEGNKTYVASDKVDEGVQFNLFCNWDKKDIYPTLSTNDIANYVMDENKMLFFNNTNYIGNPRANYTQGESGDVTYNKLQWKKVEFTYIGNDAEEWKGVWCLNTSGTDYYVVTYEAHADKFDTYFSDFEEMMDDFKKLGWENKDKSK